MNIAYRWYIGLDLEDSVPDHSTLSQNRRRRFKGTTVFEEIFLQVVRLCAEAGLVKGEAIAMDSTHVRANADNEKREAVTVVTEPREYLKKLEAEIAEKDMASHGEKKRRGPKPNERPAFHITEEIKSTTDPDSGMLGRPKKPNGFHYLCHQSADVEYGIITDVYVTAGNRLDHECCVERIKAQKENLNLPLREFVADKGYDMMEIHHMLGEMGVAVYTPVKLPHEGYRRNELSSDQFMYDKEKNMYECPGGHALHFSHYTRERDSLFQVYRSRAPECRLCPLRAKCFAPTRKVRQIKRSYSADYVEASRSNLDSERFKYLQRRRRVICEGNFANMKDNGNLRRTRKRGLDNVAEHCLLCAVALNLKKLLKFGKDTPVNPRIVTYVRRKSRNKREARRFLSSGFSFGLVCQHARNGYRAFLFS